MYVIDSGAADRWLQELKKRAATEAQQVVAVRPALREARDGSTEFFVIVVVKNDVLSLSANKRRALIGTLEKTVRNIVLVDESISADDWPVVSFRTEAEDQAAGARL